jgi:hypothetical protein
MLAGTSSTTATHQPADATRAPIAARPPRSRRRTVVSAHSSQTSPRAGTTRSTWRLLVRKPKPVNTPARAIHRIDPACTARSVAHTARAMSRVRSASGLLKRNMRTATGVTAITAPASRAAPWPNARRTVACRTATVPTPMSTCGRRIANELSPKSRTDSAMTHSAAGGLSTVMALLASKLPQKKADHDSAPAWTAAE